MPIPAYLDVNLYLQQSSDGHAHDGNELLADFIAKINEIIDALIAGGTIGDITEIVAGVNLDGGGDTGVVTIDVSPNIDLAGASSVQTIIARKAAAAQTDNAGSVILANNTGTYNTTGAATTFKQIGVYGRAQGTKSAGAPDLENWGTYGEAGGSNIAIGALGWAISGVASALNYGVFGQANAAAGSTVMGVVGYAGHGVLTKFAPDPGDLGGIFSGIFRGGTLKCESDFRHTGTNAGFFSATPTTKPTVSGSRAANAALASALTGLAGLGLITDSTTAGSSPSTPVVEHLEAAGGGASVAINPVDDVAFLGNTGAGETVTAYTLAAGTVDGHVIRLVVTTTTSTRAVWVTPSAFGGEGSNVKLTVGNGPASATLVWNHTDSTYRIIDLRNFSLSA